jgi:hypothetical protein
VADVPAAREDVLAAGGHPVGAVVTLETPGGVKVTGCYVTDPEGNMVELQSRSQAKTGQMTNGIYLKTHL